MRLPTPFIRLPWTFDADRLAREAAAFDAADWRGHPQGHPGNTALPLVAVHGDPADDGVAGPMAPTPHLARMPYLQQVLAAFDAPIGRTRLMRLDAGADATPHVDINYYWQQRLRVHVPVSTTPGVRFVCGDAAVHMAAGECWVFDTWRLHNVLNPAASERVHLVIDTVGSRVLWQAADGAGPPATPAGAVPSAPRLRFERANVPVVMTPWEIDSLWADWLADACEAGQGPAAALAVNDALQPLLRHWRALWAAHGAESAGWPEFQALQARIAAVGRACAGQAPLPNGIDLGRMLAVSLAPALCNPQLAAAQAPAGARPPAAHVPELGQSTPAASASRVAAGQTAAASRLERPLVIIAAPRSGSTLLFETLAACLPLYTVGGESHRQIEGIAPLRPDARGYHSNRLGRDDATPAVAQAVRHAFVQALRDRDGRPPVAGTPVLRMLEKTPKNALRVPFLDAVFPDARFVYLLRDPAENVGSLIDAWQSGQFVMYPDLPGWQGAPWSFLLVPGWRDLIGRPLAAVAAAQWMRTHAVLLDDLAQLPRERVHALDYRAFLQDPQRHVDAIAAFAGLDRDRPLPPTLPLARHTLSPPAPDKWRRHADAMAPYLPALEAVAGRARGFMAAVGGAARAVG